MPQAQSDNDKGKRKRDVNDTGNQPDVHPSGPPRSPPPLRPPQIRPSGMINFLPDTLVKFLQLIPGDGETFDDILGTILAYKSILRRQESLAASLGARLTGPRLLKGIDRFFEGPIKVIPAQPHTSPITWVDILSHAKTNPEDFVPATANDGSRVCYFNFRGLRVEIPDDDWRLICNGTLDRIPWDEPLIEDEDAEVATLDILEERSYMLYTKADQVAGDARLLHHMLAQRKLEMAQARRAQNAATSSASTFRDAPASTPSYDLHASLLAQFHATTENLRSCMAPLEGMQSPHGPVGIRANRQTRATLQEIEALEDTHRPEMILRVEKLHKGQEIRPTCDRCRRLKLHCVKHLTACAGCTRKHTKCTWKCVTEEEAQWMRDNPRLEGSPSPALSEAGPSNRDGLGGPAWPEALGIMSHKSRALEEDDIYSATDFSVQAQPTETAPSSAGASSCTEARPPSSVGPYARPQYSESPPFQYLVPRRVEAPPPPPSQPWPYLGSHPTGPSPVPNHSGPYSTEALPARFYMEPPFTEGEESLVGQYAWQRPTEPQPPQTGPFMGSYQQGSPGALRRGLEVASLVNH